MFKSFFPNPKWFFLSVIAYSAASIFIWYFFNEQIGKFVGLNLEPSEPVIGLGHFVTDSFLLFYGYYVVCVGLFSVFWFRVSRHPWKWWSITGSAVILFSTYFSVQVSVAINNWRRPFFDLVQNALGTPESNTSQEGVSERSAEVIASYTEQLFDLIFIFAEIAFIAIVVGVGTRFFVSHFIFFRETLDDDTGCALEGGFRNRLPLGTYLFSDSVFSRDACVSSACGSYSSRHSIQRCKDFAVEHD